MCIRDRTWSGHKVPRADKPSSNVCTLSHRDSSALLSLLQSDSVSVEYSKSSNEGGMSLVFESCDFILVPVEPKQTSKCKLRCIGCVRKSMPHTEHCLVLLGI